MLVSYEGTDEVIVCDIKNEAKMLKEYFEGGTGNGDRDIDDYDRIECTSHNKIVIISVRAKVSVE